jgi:hypothetical protein
VADMHLLCVSPNLPGTYQELLIAAQQGQGREIQVRFQLFSNTGWMMKVGPREDCEMLF